MRDPIVDEVRKVREGIFKEYGNDLVALVRHLRRRRKANRRKVVRLPPKKVQAA
jgi:hypothetical protein